ncbi:MAG: ribonuclease III [Patescibacteria group bacterium]
MNDSRDFSSLEKKIGLTFSNPVLLKQALTHRSYLNEHKDVSWDHNERLEFLGDAVLELIITDYLFHHYPAVAEGELTAYRSALVNADLVAEVGVDLDLNDYLFLSRGEARDTGRARQIILGNTVEALIGAIYLDQDFKVAQSFVGRYFFRRVDEIVANNLWQDAKSFFQEQAQAKVNLTPTYQVLNALGPDHNKRFTVGLYLGSALVATGEGHSKQEAEQAAARLGLEEKGWKR